MIERKAGYPYIDPIHLMKDGNYCTESPSGGWNYSLQQNARFNHYGSYVNLYSTTTGYNNYGMFFTNKAINFAKYYASGYTQLNIEYALVRYGSYPQNVFLTPYIYVYPPVAGTALTVTTKNVVSIDISAETVKYIMFEVLYYGSINVYNVWLN